MLWGFNSFIYDRNILGFLREKKVGVALKALEGQALNLLILTKQIMGM